MDILTATGTLITHFLKKDSINSEEFESITPKKVSKLEAEAAFSYALNDFEKKGIISKYTGVGAENKPIFIWILNRPLVANDQLIKVSGPLALTISQVVNSFYESIGEKQNFCSPINITESDISILLEMISMYAEQSLEIQDNKIKNIEQN